MEDLKLELKENIIDARNLVDLTPADIQDDAPIFMEGLGLDSIDALELMLLMEKNYGIRLANPAEGKQVFKSINAMAEYVNAHRTK